MVTGNEQTPRTVGILIFPEVEILDFCGPFEVFASAALPAQAGGAATRLFTVGTIAETPQVVRCRGGLLVQPNHTLRDHPPLDILVVPGGYGTDQVRENRTVLDWIIGQRQGGALTTSVCTGAFVLGAAGLLDGKPSSPMPASSMRATSSPRPASQPGSTWRCTSWAACTAPKWPGPRRGIWSTRVIG